MATQKENGHDSDAPPKLQQLPGRSSNKLQGRLYSNAGRGYDRESLQKMSAGEVPALVVPVEEQEDLAREGKGDYHNDQNHDDHDLKATDLQPSKNHYNIKHYLSGAALFLAGVVVGNIVIPLFTATNSIPVTEDVAKNKVSTVASVSSPNETIDSITSNPESSAGCRINPDANTSNNNESKGHSIGSSSNSETIDSITSNPESSAGCRINPDANTSNNNK